MKEHMVSRRGIWKDAIMVSASPPPSTGLWLSGMLGFYTLFAGG